MLPSISLPSLCQITTQSHDAYPASLVQSTLSKPDWLVFNIGTNVSVGALLKSSFLLSNAYSGSMVLSTLSEPDCEHFHSYSRASVQFGKFILQGYCTPNVPKLGITSSPVDQ